MLKFFGKHSDPRLDCLSQWRTSLFRTPMDKKLFYNAEQYMMWSKASLFGDHIMSERILRTSSPKEAKKLGREVSGFEEHTWELVRENVVCRGNYLKFSQNPEMRDLLLSTGDEILVECNPHDPVWSCGLNIDDPRVDDPKLWTGKNLLGKALMRVREVLRDEATISR